MGMRYRLDVTLALLALVAAVMLFVTPYMSPEGSFIHLDGSPGTIDHMNLWQSTDIISGFTYLVGDLFCTQMESRSIILNGSQMAFCSRDVSILVGFIIGSIVSLIGLINIRMKESGILCIITFALMMTDWAIQHFAEIDFMASRMVTGALFGASVALLAGAYSKYLLSVK